MAVVSVNKLFTGRGGADTFTRQRTYREQWEVVTNEATDDEEVAAGASAAALGLPRLGQPHDRFPFAVCTEIEAQQSEDTPFHWLVAVKYDSNPPLPNGTTPDGAGQSPADIPANPLLRPATWELSFETTTEPATTWRVVDAGGNLAGNYTPVRNSAKLPFDPALQVEVSRPVYRITKALPFLPTAFVASLENALNDRLWRGLPKWTAKIRGCRASNKYENGVAYVELSLEIAIKAETWVPKILDAGLYALEKRDVNRDGNKRDVWVRIVDPLGGDGPFPLDGNGQRLAADKDPVFLRGIPGNFQLQNFAALLNL